MSHQVFVSCSQQQNLILIREPRRMTPHQLLYKCRRFQNFTPCLNPRRMAKYNHQCTLEVEAVRKLAISSGCEQITVCQVREARLKFIRLGRHLSVRRRPIMMSSTLEILPLFLRLSPSSLQRCPKAPTSSTMICLAMRTRKLSAYCTTMHRFAIRPDPSFSSISL